MQLFLKFLTESFCVKILIIYVSVLRKTFSIFILINAYKCRIVKTLIKTFELYLNIFEFATLQIVMIVCVCGDSWPELNSSGCVNTTINITDSINSCPSTRLKKLWKNIKLNFIHLKFSVVIALNFDNQKCLNIQNGMILNKCHWIFRHNS